MPVRDNTWPVIAWEGLLGYVLTAEALLGAFGKPLMTDAWREALNHPVKRWMVITAWGLTTKHLFFPKVLPWLDPFSFIGLVLVTIKRVLQQTGVLHA